MLAGAKGKSCDGCHNYPVDFREWKIGAEGTERDKDMLQLRSCCPRSSQPAAEMFFRGEIRSRKQQQA
jgi:hypothetical protein